MKHILWLPFLATLLSCNDAGHHVVAVVPLGRVDDLYVDTVAKALRSEYPFRVVVIRPVPIPPSFKVSIKAPRFRADSILRFLRRIKPDSVDHMVGLLADDISVTKTENGKVKMPEHMYRDWGVFGYGYRPGPACVISTFRLGKADVLTSRLKKVAIHELGHNLGLPHCTDLQCPMQDAVESISTVDRSGSTLCPSCKARAN